MESLLTANLKQRPPTILVKRGPEWRWVLLSSCFLPGWRAACRVIYNAARRTSVGKSFLLGKVSSDNLMSSPANLSTKYVDPVEGDRRVAQRCPVVPLCLSGKRRLGFENFEGVDWDQYSAT